MKKFLCIALLLLMTLSLTGCSNLNDSQNNQSNDTFYKQKYEEALKNQAPTIKDITFKTMDGKTIEKSANWYMLDKQVKITITLEGDCQYVDLFVTPTGTETSKIQKLIEEVDTNKNVVEYIWNVPDDTHEQFNIIAYNKDVGRKSDYYNVVSKQALK